ncbi:MAG: hypothetical protein ABI693_28675 [Bryobacteraceae bacterium]
MAAIRVEFDEAVIQDIRARSIEGSQAMPFGGLEVGGVLFGTHDEGILRVKAWKPMACEHKRGPGLQLSRRDEDALVELLHGAPEDPLVKGMAPVGWFRSTRKQTLTLSEEDAALHAAFFPAPWQAALVLKPKVFGSSRIAVFAADESGSLQLAKAVQEFEVSGPPAAPSTRRERPVFGERQERREAPPAPPPTVEPLPIPTFEPVTAASEPRGLIRWAVTAVVVLTLVAASIVWFLKQPAALAAVPIQITGEGGKLRFSWDPQSPAIRQSSGGKLQIVDGDANRELLLDRAALFGGGATYTPASGEVTVKLIINTPSGPLEQSTRYLSPSTGGNSQKRIEELTRERDALREKARQLEIRAVYAERKLDLMKKPPSPQQ